MEQRIRWVLIIEAMGILIGEIMATIILEVIVIMLTGFQEKVSHCITLCVGNGTLEHVHLETDVIVGMYAGHAQKQGR